MHDRTASAAHHAFEFPPASSAKEFGMPFAVGEIVAAKYEIESLLGVGSIGFVVSARRIDLGDKVALKFLRPESLSNEDLVARFGQEARFAASIKSDHIARVLDIGRATNGSPFIVMERLEGRDLGRVLSEGGRLPVPVAVEYMLEVCEALAAAHARGIVHRDIKPENLFLSELVNGEDIVKVLDFGISKVALAGVLDPARLVRTSVILGSPVYMSPEQIRESADVDARTDIWSLGCVLYELLAGSPAFDGQSLMQLCSVILEQSPTPLSALNPQVTPELEAVVWRCLAKDPADRFQNVADLAGALAQCTADGARIWAERCKFLLAGTDPGPPGPRELGEPPPSRASLRGPVSSRRSLPPVAVGVPEMNVRPRKPWKIIAAALAVLALAAACLLLSVTTLIRPQQGAASSGRQPLAVGHAGPSTPHDVTSSLLQSTANVLPAPSAAPVASTPLPSVSPSPSASSVPNRPVVVEPLKAAAVRSAERRPTLTASAPRIPNRLVTAADDEPDVGY